MKITPIKPIATYYRNNNKQQEQKLWYCQHCGHKNYTGKWFENKCPKCSASTKPKEW